MNIDPIAHSRIGNAQADDVTVVVDAFKANRIEPRFKTLALQFGFDGTEDIVPEIGFLEVKHGRT